VLLHGMREFVGVLIGLSVGVLFGLRWCWCAGCVDQHARTLTSPELVCMTSLGLCV
jgi:hypothetical protein